MSADEGLPHSAAATETEAEQEDGLRLRVEAVSLCEGDNESEEVGTLEISTESVSWSNGRRSVSYPYLQILLHAVCRDTEAYPQPCIYCHVEQGDETVEVRFVPAGAASAAGEGSASTASATAAGAEATEEANVLDEIFRVMSECASLHMDPEEDFGSGGGAGVADADLAGGDYFFTAADFAHGVSDEGVQNLERLDGLIQVAPELQDAIESQFEDPEEDE